MITLLKQDKKLRLLFIAGLLIQIWFSYIQVGFFHPDQHFQIVEFSSHQLHETNFVNKIWEFNDQIRPTFQVYLLSALRILLSTISINDGFCAITIVQTITGILMFLLFNAIAIHYFKDKKKVLYLVLLILNFSWSFPFIKSMFSSEILSSLLFFGALFYFDTKQNKTPVVALITGFVMALAFYTRFQMAFAIMGVAVWCMFIQKQYKPFLFIAIGFLAGIAINILLDYFFYKNWVFTPYNYFYQNIVKGVANSFGTSSPLDYVLVMCAVMSTPLLSIILFGICVWSCIKNWKNSIVISVVFFLVGHCFIGHKEERFLFPIFCTLPVILGFQLDNFLKYIAQKKWLKNLVAIFLYASILLNLFLLIVFSVTPYSQTVYMSYLLNKQFNASTDIYAIKRTPVETESLLQLKFYENTMHNIHFKKLDSVPELMHTKPTYLVAEFNQIADDRSKIESYGYKKVFTSSNLLWNINEKLYNNKMNTINDIWALYQLK